MSETVIAHWESKRSLSHKRLSDALLCARNCESEPKLITRLETWCSRLDIILEGFNDAHINLVCELQKAGVDDKELQGQSVFQEQADDMYFEVLEAKRKYLKESKVELASPSQPCHQPKAKTKLPPNKLPTFTVCLLACQTGFVCAWPSYTTAGFRSNDTVLSEPMSSLQISLLGSLPNVGGLLISPFCSYAFNTFGRKYATMLFGLPYVIAWTIIAVTSNVTLVLLAIALAGVGIAGQNVSMIYISEIAHDSIRGGLTSCSASGYFLGIMISHILGGQLSYMQVVYTHLTLSALTIALLMLLKESPVYLVMAGKEKEAAEAVAFYRRLDVKSKEVEAELAKIRLQVDPRLETILEAAADPAAELLKTKEEAVDHQQPRSVSPWKFLVKSKSSQRALFTVMTITTLTIMMGCVVLQVYAEPLFMEAVPSLPPNTCAILVAADFLVASLVCAFLIDRFGRKSLLVVTASASGVATLLLGAQLQFHWAPHWVTAMLIYMYSFVYTSGCATIPFVLAAEVFVPEVRSLGNSIVMGFVWLVNFITLIIFNPLVEAVGLGLVFYLFSAVCFAGAVYSQFCVPETKGLSVTEIQKKFVRERRKARN